MKRKILVLILTLAMVLSSVPSVWAAGFTDTGSGELAMAAAVLQGMDVVAGKSAGTFDPDGTLTRAQACTMLVKLMGLDSMLSTGAKKTYFSDVPASAWYAPYVNLAYSNGLINGYGNGKFGPDDNISYGQLATIILRMLGYSSSDVGYVWPADYTALCEDLGISADFTVADNAKLSRGQAALMLYRSLSCKTRDGRQTYYETVADVASTKELLVMSVDAEKNGAGGLLLGYSQGIQGSEMVYIAQENVQSEIIEGYTGKVLLNSLGNVVGFLPSEDSSFKDLTLQAAGLSFITVSGTKYRVGDSVKVLDSTQESSWTSGGYLKGASRKGETVRVYFDSDGAVKLIYLFPSSDGGEEDSPLVEYTVSGYISSVSPSLISTESVCVAGSSFPVSEAAADAFSGYKIGEKVTLTLSEELEVCSVSKDGIYDKMLGLLSADGRSVTLAGSGVRLSASTIKYSDKLAGGMVLVTESSMGTLYCYEAGSKALSGDIHIAANTLGGTPISQACEIYEWTGSGFLCSLEGVRGEASRDFEAISWTDTIDDSKISWCHLDAEGQVDVIVLKDVTGSCYSYGYLNLYEDEEGIDLGSKALHAYNRAGVLANGNGNGQKSICVITDDEAYCGVAYGCSSSNNAMVAVKPLSSFTVDSLAALSLEKDSDGEDCWYVSDGNEKYPVSDAIQVYDELSGNWSTEMKSVMSFLESSYQVSFYYDQLPENGGMVRIAVIEE